MDSYQIQARLSMCTLNGWQIKLICGRPMSTVISGGQLVKPSLFRVSIVVEYLSASIHAVKFINRFQNAVYVSNNILSFFLVMIFSLLFWRK